MQENVLIQISSKIKEKRLAKNITIQELANKARVSKGLISQIENNRTIPSLPVLMNIVDSLDFDMTEFFSGISSGNHSKVIIIRPNDQQLFKKEVAKGFVYRRIMTLNLNCNPADFILLELKKGARRKQTVHTDALEFKYMIRGTVEYTIENEKYILNEGDSLFFDGHMGHNLVNIGNTDAMILVVYCFSVKAP
jgi:transcriptional regulator with XRE-family HTH domain